MTERLYSAIYQIELLFDCDDDIAAESIASDIAHAIAALAEDNGMDVADLCLSVEPVECEVFDNEQEEEEI